MPDLPDVPQQAWNTFAADRWFNSTNERINSIQPPVAPTGLGFLNSSSSLINGLQTQVQPAPPIQIPQPSLPIPTPAPAPTPLPTPMPAPAPSPLPQPLPQPSPMPQPGFAPSPPPVSLPQPVAPTPPDQPIQVLPQLPQLGGGQPTLPTPPVFAPTPAPKPVESPFGGEVTGPFAPGTTERYTPPTMTAPVIPPVQTGLGAIDSSTPAAFAQSFAPYAQYAAQQLGIDPSWVTAMAASESNYGKAGGNELFGIKALPGQAGTSMMTHEGEYGGTNMAQTFASYDTPLDAVKAYVNLLKNHYPGAVGATDLGTFVHGLKQGGYFTAAEPEYRGILGAIANRGDIQQGLQQGLGNAAQAVGTAASTVGSQVRATANTVSQFGDKQLSTDEAYAACGPAAAVRFAQAYGRNPTLREATDLAATVGWTSGQGMAGLGSEKRLMDKLGVPTRLVGADTSAMAHEAQTGNPVTISTPGHYFYADGYNPQTGAFHVGQSGLDLRGGSEWMTPEQMSARMGPIQGALFADNPSAPAVSTAAPVTDQLSQTRSTLSSALSGKPTAPVIPRQAMTDFGSSPDPQLQQLDQAVQTAAKPSRPNYLSVFDTSAPTAFGPPTGGTGGSPFDQIGQAISSAIQNALGGLGGGGPRRDELAAQDQTQPQDQSMGARTRELIRQSQMLPGGHTLQEFGVPDILPPDFSGKSPGDAIKTALEAAGKQALNRQSPVLGPGGLGIYDPRLGADPRQDVPPFLDPVEAIGNLLHGVTGWGGTSSRVAKALEDAYTTERIAGIGRGVGELGGTLASNVGSPLSASSPVKALADQGQQSLAQSLDRNAGQGAWDSFVRQYSDRNVDLNHISEDLQRRLGRPLRDDENIALLAVFDPTHQSEVATEMNLGPSLRAIPSNALDDYYAWQRRLTNKSANEGLASQVEQQYLQGGIAPSTEERLSRAIEDLTTSQQAHDDAVAQAANPRTRDQISIATAQRRVDESRAQLEAAAEAARQVNAEAAQQRVLQSPSASVVTHPELRDLTIAENNAKVLNQRYERLFGTNPDNPYLETLGRQVGRAEDRAAQLRSQMGERSVTRGQAIETRAQTAADTAFQQQPRYNPTPEYAGANVKLRYEQQNLDRLQTQQARGVKGLSDDVARAQKRVDKAAADVAQAQADLPAAARAQGQAQLYGRTTQGETYDQTLQAIQDIEAKYANQPKTLQAFQDARQAVRDYREQLLQHQVDSGLIDQGTADGLIKMYPDWTPTRQLDYVSDEGPAGLPRGNRVNVSDPGIHRYTLEGSTGESMNHVAALMQEADRTYALGAKNRLANSVVNAQRGEGGALKKIADTWDEYHAAPANSLHSPDYNPKPGQGEFKISAMVDGQKQEYVTTNPYLKQAIENVGATPDPVAKAANWLTRAVRETAVSRNPLWLAGNSIIDAAGYAVGTTAAGGVRRNLVSGTLNLGPALITARTTDKDDPNRGQKIAAAAIAGFGTRALMGNSSGLGPSALREFLLGYGDVLKGLGSGRMTGAGGRELMLAGGGMRGGHFFGGGVKAAEERLNTLTRPNAFSLRNATDAKQLFNDAALFGWVKALGDRFEQAPRIAAYRVAKQRGETQLQAMARARNVTIDFDRGGQFSKALNGFIPFFNAGAQGGAQFARLAGLSMLDKPKGNAAQIATRASATALAGMSLVGMPTVAAEIWNRSDPQRSRDYDNVPQYLKDQGVVLMLPGEAPVDKNGNRMPQHIDVNVREFAPFAVAAREAFNRMPRSSIAPLIGQDVVEQGQPKDALDLAGSLAAPLSPFNTRNAADATFGLVPAPLSTIGGLAINKDTYRNASIANQFSDENASAFGKWLAPHLEDAISSMPGASAARIHPSQVDFATRDVFNGLGSTALGTSDVLTGQPPRAPGLLSDTPVVGGAIGRFVRGTGGQERTDVTSPEQLLAPDLRQQLRALGGSTQYYEPTTVPSDIQKIPLRQNEQVEYQRQVNQLFDQNLRRVKDLPAFQDELLREYLIRQSMDSARTLAQARVLRQIREGGGNVVQRYMQKSSAL